MGRRQDLDRILREWPYEPGDVSARLVKATDGRQVLQMRVEMGILQLEIEHRPDGQRPGGANTYFEHLVQVARREGKSFELSPEQCAAADREFLQFYHRRICWLALRKFHAATRDADHSLAFMDFVRAHSTDEEWTLSHEQYRPFVLFHRTQAASLAKLEEIGPEAAIQELQQGLQRFRDLFAEYDAAEQYEDDELVRRLIELKDTLREQYNVKPSLSEQLADAVAAEQYELAAKLRDELHRRAAQVAARKWSIVAFRCGIWTDLTTSNRIEVRHGRRNLARRDLALKTRRFGTVAEVLVQRLVKLGKAKSLFHDLFDDWKNQRVEVKFSVVRKAADAPITEATVLQAIEAATSQQRMVAFDEWKHVDFDCNIQQIKRAEFDVLYYGLFFSDSVVVFRIERDEIGSKIQYSDLQHKGNVGEGQFHVNPRTMQVHLDNCAYRTLTYDALLQLLTD